jgi:hypothetical protein
LGKRLTQLLAVDFSIAVPVELGNLLGCGLEFLGGDFAIAVLIECGEQGIHRLEGRTLWRARLRLLGDGRNTGQKCQQQGTWFDFHGSFLVGLGTFKVKVWLQYSRQL